MTKAGRQNLAVAALLVYLAVPVSLWFIAANGSEWSSGSSIFRSVGQIAGLLGASLFSLNFVLAARLRFMEELLNGLPKIFNAHHLFGGLALILLLAHPVLLGLQFVAQSVKRAAEFYIPGLDNIPELFGSLALGILVGLLFITFFVRIAYHKWKSTHQWLGLALLFASLHVYLIPGHLSGAPFLRFYMLLVIITGLLAFCYRVLFGRWLVRRYGYIVKEVIVHEEAAEVSLKPAGKAIQHKAGQFFFVSVRNAKKVTREQHPFSFTDAPDHTEVSFAAKSLGDYTESVRFLKPGEEVTIEGPYGRFIFDRGAKEQVWIAGGIGITPFMSRAKELDRSLDSKINLYYIVRDAKNALFLSELKHLEKTSTNFKLHIWESEKAGRFTVQNIARLKPASGRDYFICGPVPMITSMKQGLRQAGIGRDHIYAEEFKLY